MIANKKLGILFLASIILAFLAGLFVSRVVPAFQPDDPQDLYAYVTEQFESYYYYDIDDEDKHNAFIASIEAVIQSYAEANNDPYTRLVRVPVNQVPSDTETFYGLGLYITYEGLNLRVEGTFLNGPSENILYPNDLIIGIEVASEDILFESLETIDQVMAYIGFEFSTEKTLIVKDPDDVIHKVSVGYDVINTPTVSTEDLEEPDIAYIRIHEFAAAILGTDNQVISLGTAAIFDEILRELEDDILVDGTSPKTLILDLRDNPGGSLSALHNRGTNQLPGITQQLIARNDENNLLFSLIDKNNTVERYEATQTTPKPYDIKVLVNENSASASEVLAAALWINGGYEVYGQPTFGKGVFQNQIELITAHGYTYYLYFTEGAWYYDEDKNVSTDPIDVILIDQEGIKALPAPVYGGVMRLDTYSPYLSAYQMFLNHYFAYEGDNVLRIDGYFDLKTQNAVLDFNNLHGQPGQIELNRTSAIRIHEIYLSQLKEIDNDSQLQQLIEIIKQG